MASIPTGQEEEEEEEDLRVIAIFKIK